MEIDFKKRYKVTLDSSDLAFLVVPRTACIAEWNQHKIYICDVISSFHEGSGDYCEADDLIKYLAVMLTWYTDSPPTPELFVPALIGRLDGDPGAIELLPHSLWNVIDRGSLSEAKN